MNETAWGYSKSHNRGTGEGCGPSLLNLNDSNDSGDVSGAFLEVLQDFFIFYECMLSSFTPPF